MSDLSADSAPALTASVNAAIQLFAELLPLQDLGSVTRTVTQLLEATNSSKFEKNTGRKAAVLVNSTIALVLAFRKAQAQKAGDTLGNAQVTNALSDFLKVASQSAVTLFAADIVYVDGFD